MKKSDAKKEKKRQRILSSAVRVFSKKGFYSTSIKEIARAASVADGTIYLYFKNKDDILISIFNDRFRKLNAKMDEIADQPLESSEKIRMIINLQIGTVRGHRDLAEVLTVNLRQSNSFLRQFAAPQFNRYLDIMAQIIREGQDRGEFASDYSPRILATSLFGAIDGLMLTWVLGSRKYQRLVRAGTHVAEMMLNGLRPR
ncbi:MAG: TetR/AcrR family transcriptional regulator [Pseudomonadota bacterium]